MSDTYRFNIERNIMSRYHKKNTHTHKNTYIIIKYKHNIIKSIILFIVFTVKYLNLVT